MDGRIPKRSAFKFFVLSIITLGIYAIVFWHKLGKNVNTLCEGDGKRTMKYLPAFFLSVITFGIYGIIWKVQLAQRLKVNAERYELDIPEDGTMIALFHTLGIIALGAGIPIANYLIIKNYNMIAEAFNSYNDLEETEEEKNAFVDIFGESVVLYDEADEEPEAENEDEFVFEDDSEPKVKKTKADKKAEKKEKKANKKTAKADKKALKAAKKADKKTAKK